MRVGSQVMSVCHQVGTRLGPSQNQVEIKEAFENWRFQIGTSKRCGSKYAPMAFIEQGVAVPAVAAHELTFDFRLDSD